MRWRMLRVLVVIVMLDCVWSWQGRTVTFHRLDLDDLVGFVSDSTAAVSSDGCPALVEVAYEGRDEVRIDPSAMSLVPSCEKLGTRRMLSYGKLCEDVKNYGGEGCEERGCEVWKEELERDMPFNVSVMEGATLYVYRETNFTGGRSLSAFLMEDTPVGGCEEYLESVQSGTEPRHRDDIGRRTFLSGDVLIVKVEKNGTAEKECLFVAEDRHQDARYMVSHRVRVADEETADVEGSEAKFQQTWAAKVGLWKDMIVAEFTEDVRSRRKYLELRVKRVSKAKALLLAKQITRADLLGRREPKTTPTKKNNSPSIPKRHQYPTTPVHHNCPCTTNFLLHLSLYHQLSITPLLVPPTFHHSCASTTDARSPPADGSSRFVVCFFFGAEFLNSGSPMVVGVFFLLGRGAIRCCCEGSPIVCTEFQSGWAPLVPSRRRWGAVGVHWRLETGWRVRSFGDPPRSVRGRHCRHPLRLLHSEETTRGKRIHRHSIQRRRYLRFHALFTRL